MSSQKPYMIIEDLEQLKAVSDPFRTKLLSLLLEHSYTGQQLSKLVEVPRSKVHYALSELEKHGFVEIVRTEEKGGVLQKYYKATAKGYIPSETILPYIEDVGNYYRELIINILNRARIRTLTAPEEAFNFTESIQGKQPLIAMQLETKASEEQFIQWLNKYRKLIDDFLSMSDEGGNFYYLTTIGFQIDEPYFEENKKEHNKED
ncbi:winged helix-turn-helix domain-containing protein [Heyndrickxia sporothermodurans]|uniref:winged helix-turn-helix domain-containing protein n=1 Tax=Bacillaceae TaxID=186817 RepID=UPI00126951C1|nr:MULTISPECIES: winged helix-turn-helix domain-containing protein [Bacillaceae]MEB6550964.1 winged helix-turn-helix domain-containing protein [Heyndrickxia sporothermodurans]MED1678681.1 winged helix-turn-helix domain-containing protein [Bacillus subtilis]MED3652133.1 winged helix-turn-helix domain-containing protein [Heyndrickxia sporothermodurans]MED3696408.1 winged helix-turn-helix domain-containing protein [Heyndrickxia sporothermodurans]MED3782557.1 winged helix-turn-helix domain-contain